jgi:glycosyltransferase involved in cell wall biosynthesis
MRSIVVPTYNEESRIGAAIRALADFDDTEIIVSDDGSTDGTLEKVQDLIKDNKNVKLLRGGHLGKGAALINGFNASEGDVLGFLDADLSAKPSELLKLFQEVEKGRADLAIGSREMPASNISQKQPFHRRILGNLYSLIARALFGVDIRDFQCGCKAFKRELWEAINVKSKGFVFDTDLIAKAHNKGFKLVEIPITWRNDERTKVNSFSDPLKMFLDLIRIKWQSIRKS